MKAIKVTQKMAKFIYYTFILYLSNKQFSGQTSVLPPSLFPSPRIRIQFFDNLFISFSIFRVISYIYERGGGGELTPISNTIIVQKRTRRVVRRLARPPGSQLSRRSWRSPGTALFYGTLCRCCCS